MIGVISKISCGRRKLRGFFWLDFMRSFGSDLERIISDSLGSFRAIRSLKGRVESVSVFLWGRIGGKSGFGRIKLSIFVIKDRLIFFRARELRISDRSVSESFSVGKCLKLLGEEGFVLDLMVGNDIRGAEVAKDRGEFEVDLLWYRVEFR